MLFHKDKYVHVQWNDHVDHLYHECYDLPGVAHRLGMDTDIHRTYYWLSIRDGQDLKAFPIKTFFGEEQFARLCDPVSDLHLVICNNHEAFTNVIDHIYFEIVHKGGVPAHKVIWITGAVDAKKHVERASKSFMTPEIKTMVCLEFEYNVKNMMHNGIADDNWKPPLTLQHGKDYSKFFLSFNRRRRPNRLMWIQTLVHEGLIDQGFVSLSKLAENPTWLNDPANIVKEYGHRSPYILEAVEKSGELFNNHYDHLVLDPLLDYSDMAHITTNTDMYYENSLVSAVTETNFFHNQPGYSSSVFLTEKTYKPILYRHPFVMVSVPNTLSYLRYAGYQTFDGIWDESYDNIVDEGERLKAIAETLKYIGSLKGAAQTKLINECREVVSFNYRTLINRPDSKHQWYVN